MSPSSERAKKDLLVLNNESTTTLTDSSPQSSSNSLIPTDEASEETLPEPKQVRYSMREQLIGFPWWQMTIVMMVRFSEPVSFTSLFPYVYFMVKHLRPEGTESSIARYAGYISGTFALCQALTGVHWGRYSDKYGRKPILLMGLLGTAVSLLWFGTAESFLVAMLARCLSGFLNGNVGVIRTAIGEIAPLGRHQAFAMSTMSLLWQTGCVVGPTMGGTLADPVHNHPSWFPSDDEPDNFWKALFLKKPFLLPNMVTSGLLFFSAVIAFLFLEESNEDFKPRNAYDPGLALGDKFIRFITRGKVDLSKRKRWDTYDEESDSEIDSSKKSPVESTENTSLLERVDSAIEEDLEYVSGEFTSRSRRQSAVVNQSYGSTKVDARPPSPEPKKYDNGNFLDSLTPPVVATIAVYGLLGVHNTVFDEILPVMLSTPIATPKDGGPSRLPFHFVGGLGLSSDEVGRLLSFPGVLGIFFVLFFFPYVNARYGTYKVFTISSQSFPITHFAMPFALLLVNSSVGSTVISAVIGSEQPTLSTTEFRLLGLNRSAWFVLGIICFKALLLSCAYPSVMLLINRAIPNRRHAGGINGLAQMCAAFCRALGPFIWGIIMAKGAELELMEMPWVILGLFAMTTFIFVKILSQYKTILAEVHDF